LEKSRLGQIMLPAAVVLVVAVMVIPLPSAVLDVLIVANLSTAILILLVSMNVKQALEFSSFPSLLLVVTLLRLGLNVATSRAVLSKGHAGDVIATFGSFVVGGSLVVGLVIFILTLVQFVVISNGSGRVAEVTARFTLDAMPGKQMAIDADLNAGIIDENEARRRRKEVGDEADFYGAMDGASKFVKGDAIAGDRHHHGQPHRWLHHRRDADGHADRRGRQTYSLLTVGDGLISQIPALLVSISAGLIVTRAAGGSDLGSDVFAQFRRQRPAMRAAGGVVLLMAIVPGLPKIPFVLMGATLLFVSSRLPDEQQLAFEAGPARRRERRGGAAAAVAAAARGRRPRRAARAQHRVRPHPARRQFERRRPARPCGCTPPQDRVRARVRDAVDPHPRRRRPAGRHLRHQGARCRGRSRDRTDRAGARDRRRRSTRCPATT
jgi:flagellar biosynthesis protein FlhA